MEGAESFVRPDNEKAMEVYRFTPGMLYDFDYPLSL